MSECEAVRKTGELIRIVESGPATWCVFVYSNPFPTPPFLALVNKMTNAVSSETLDKLQGQVAESLQAFNGQHQEADRLAALKAAQELANALRKPQDSVYHLAYSVISPRFRAREWR